MLDNLALGHLTLEYRTLEHLTLDHLTLEHLTLEHLTLEHLAQQLLYLRQLRPNFMYLSTLIDLSTELSHMYLATSINLPLRKEIELELLSTTTDLDYISIIPTPEPTI